MVRRSRGSGHHSPFRRVEPPAGRAEADAPAIAARLCSCLACRKLVLWDPRRRTLKGLTLAEQRVARHVLDLWFTYPKTSYFAKHAKTPGLGHVCLSLSKRPSV
jgi:hypothetical protein